MFRQVVIVWVIRNKNEFVLKVLIIGIQKNEIGLLKICSYFESNSPAVNACSNNSSDSLKLGEPVLEQSKLSVSSQPNMEKAPLKDWIVAIVVVFDQNFFINYSLEVG